MDFPEKLESFPYFIIVKYYLKFLNLYSEEELKSLEYHRVKLVGEFDHSKELYLGPRSCLTDGGAENSNGLFSGSTKSGYYVITPFKLSNKPYEMFSFF